MKTKAKLTAPILRVILTTMIGILILASAVGVYFVHDQLSAFAAQVNDDNSKAVSSEQDITRLEQLKGEMAKDPVAITRAQEIVGDSTHYQYQNQIIDDLTAYATAAGFQINSFTFAGSTTPTAGAGNALAAPTTPSSTAMGATPAPAGLKITQATITFPKAISYKALMTFLKSIEQNLTKMEITGVSLQTDPETGLLAPNPLTIGVYIK